MECLSIIANFKVNWLDQSKTLMVEKKITLNTLIEKNAQIKIKFRVEVIKFLWNRYLIMCRKMTYQL